VLLETFRKWGGSIREDAISSRLCRTYRAW